MTTESANVDDLTPGTQVDLEGDPHFLAATAHPGCEHCATARRAATQHYAVVLDVDTYGDVLLVNFDGVCTTVRYPVTATVQVPVT